MQTNSTINVLGRWVQVIMTLFAQHALSQIQFNFFHEKKNQKTRNICRRILKMWVLTWSWTTTNRPATSRSVDQWPPSSPFQRIHMDWAFFPDAGNVLVIVDSGSGWIEAFRCQDRTSQIVIKCLRTVFFSIRHSGTCCFRQCPWIHLSRAHEMVGCSGCQQNGGTSIFSTSEW